ncbi:hypothetical protein EPO33_02185 [Patescibacteria group bacterium]|nr:MAG: hypothetical protein EPO33_02185 [Patescibacteria group bacterium]
MPTPFTGPAGEHYVLYRLLQREYVAGLAPENAPNSDIIATNVKGTKAAAIQVKTRRPLGSDDGWHMKDKHEELVGERMFYCFVDLKQEATKSPDVYILPSRVVATVLKETNRIWLHQPGKNGQKHKETVMRRLLPDYSKTLRLSDAQKKRFGKGWIEKYKEDWSILGLD